jgi:chromosome partitioning protein
LKSIVLTNQKGGVAKTTTAYALAAGLHNKGYTVLIVDADPQSNLSYTAGVDEAPKSTLYEVLKGSVKTTEAIRSIKPGLDLLMVGLTATAADMELAGRTAREYMISEALQDVSGNYDFCVLDTAPTLGLLTLNALTAANYAIIPMNLEVYSLQGMEQLSGFIDNVRKYTNNALKVSGLLLTKYNDRLNLTQALKSKVEYAAEVMGTVVYNTTIRESVAVKETQLLRGDIYTEAPKATATLDYVAFVDEFLSREVLNNGK